MNVLVPALVFAMVQDRALTSIAPEDAENTSSTASSDGDWPHWAGPLGNCTSGEKGLLKSWPQEGPKILWRIPVTAGSNHPSIAGHDLCYAQLEDSQSRRSLVRAAALSAIAAIPVVAALSRTRQARANVECTDLLCQCANCYGSCGGHFFICKSLCFDAHTGSCCGIYCPGPGIPGCGQLPAGCDAVSCGGSQC